LKKWQQYLYGRFQKDVYSNHQFFYRFAFALCYNFQVPSRSIFDMLHLNFHWRSKYYFLQKLQLTKTKLYFFTSAITNFLKQLLKKTVDTKKPMW